ncbi:MAG: hemagglutinin, partial [Acidobacteria bacterium]|nr:hemagglutinin [Acidobacteriota bacterium]
GTATAPADYEDFFGPVVIEPLQMAGDILLWVKGDRSIEPDEQFTVTLGFPTNATIDRAVSTVTILNDDGPLPPHRRLAR